MTIQIERGATPRSHHQTLQPSYNVNKNNLDYEHDDELRDSFALRESIIVNSPSININPNESNNNNTNIQSVDDLIKSAMALPQPLTPEQSLKLANMVQDALPQTDFTHDDQGRKFNLDTLPKDRYAGDNGIQSGDSWSFWARWAYGVMVTINFVIVWALPNLIPGFLFWDLKFNKIGTPIYQWLNTHPKIRKFAENYIYTNPRNADFFVQTVLSSIQFIIAFSFILWAQWTTPGGITWYHIFIYYVLWVGIRGSGVAGVFAVMHCEGHSPTFYRPWIRNTVGGIHEDLLSPVYGAVPKNTSISHTYLHHGLGGRSGDSFYQADVNCTSWVEFMVVIHRISLHQLGITPVIQLQKHGLWRLRNQYIREGLLPYWVIFPAIIYALTGSFWFLFWIYFQPHFCIAFISSFGNIAFHSFIDYQEDGLPAECVFSADCYGARDDWFHQHAHMMHHLDGNMHWSDINPTTREKYREYFGHYQAAVFKDLDIVDFTSMILDKRYDQLAAHVLQYNDEPAPNKPSEDELIARAYFEAEHLSNTTKPSVFIGMGKLSLKEIAVMLEVRAKRREPKWLRYAALATGNSTAYSLESNTTV